MKYQDYRHQHRKGFSKCVVAVSRILLRAELHQYRSSFLTWSLVTRSLLSAFNKSLQDKTLRIWLLLSTAWGLWLEQQSTIRGVSKLVHKHGKVTNHIQLTLQISCSYHFTRLLTATQKMLILPVFKALHWAFYANLYSCQLMFFKLCSS